MCSLSGSLIIYRKENQVSSYCDSDSENNRVLIVINIRYQTKPVAVNVIC